MRERLGRSVPPFLVVLAGFAAAARLAAAPPAPAIQYVDVTAAAKIAFKHTSGAFGKKYLPETMGAGGAFLDFDNDGWPDVFLVNSKNWPGRPGGPFYPALYRNNRDGTFTDVTKAAGLAVELYGMGVAAADYDNDGWPDLYVTALGGNRLFRNLGDGRFADVTARAGVGGIPNGFGTSAMFLDYDKDGKLDLFVANYVAWSIDKDLFCTLDGKTKSYCTPESYQGQSPTLYRNKGDGTFEDVTQKAGLFNPSSKSLGVALLDLDNDGWPDLLVANDTQPNKLYRNNGNGTFTDVGVTAGIAFGETGVARAGMGVDAADYSGSGRSSVIIGNFSNEMIGLYHNEGNGLFVDEAPTSAVGQASLLTLAFATFFFDYDLDGRLDIFAGNGHVADDIGAVQDGGEAGARAAAADRGPGGRLRGLRQRRGPGPSRHHQQRPRVSSPQRRGQPEPLPAGQDGGHPVQPRRHRGPGHGHPRERPEGLAARPLGLQLLLAERAGPDLRPRRSAARRFDRGGLAERAGGPDRPHRRQPDGDDPGGQGPRIREASVRRALTLVSAPPRPARRRPPDRSPRGAPSVRRPGTAGPGS